MLDGVKNRVLGVKCERCGERNRDEELCAHCGISLNFSRPAILSDNRWEAAPDELAVFFKAKQLAGIFSKTVRVPAGMRAWILQESKASELPEGEYTTETFLTRLNNLFGDKHTEILITRQAALPVEFCFTDIPTAEFLDVTANLTLYVRVGDLAAFRNHFMLRAGSVSTGQLRDILQPSVQQVIVETLGGLRIEEMLTQGNLRQQVDENLMRELQSRFADFGLAFDRVDTLSLRHDRFSETRELVGSLWLERDEKRVMADHQAELNTLYDAQELEKIRQKEAEMRRRYRCAELTQEEAELAQVIRLREIRLYSEVIEAETTKKVAELENGNRIEIINSDFARKRQARERDLFKENWQAEDEDSQLRHARELAGLRRAAELTAQREQQEREKSLEHLRIENAIEKLRIQNAIEQSRLNEDDESRRQQQEIENALALQVKKQEQEINDQQHQLRVQQLQLQKDKRQRLALREEQWDEELLRKRIDDLGKKVKAEADLRVSEGEASVWKIRYEGHNQRKRIEQEGLIRLAETRLKEESEKRRQAQEILENEHQRRLQQEADEHARYVETARLRNEEIQIIGSLPSDMAIAATRDPATLQALIQERRIKAAVDGKLSADVIIALSITESEHATEAYKSGKTAASSPVPVAAAPVNSDVNEKLLQAALDAKNEVAQSWQQAYHSQQSVNGEAQRTQAELARHAIDGSVKASVGVASASANKSSDPHPHERHTPESAATSHATPHYAGASGAQGWKRCPDCGKANLPNARRCGFCASPQSLPPDANFKHCPACGMANLSNAQRCGFCDSPQPLV